jgi:integrase
MTEKGRKPKTINNVVNLAKGILNVAIDYKLIRENPWRKVKNLKIDEQDFRYWTQAQSDQFLETCWKLRPELAELVQVAIHTGLRWGELHALMKEDIDFGTGLITVQRTFSARLRKILKRTKNKKVRRVEMSPMVIPIMRRLVLKSPDKFIFRRPLINHAREYIQAMSAKAEVPVLGVHDLRHTCASQLVMAGVPLLMVSKHLGHRDTRVTERYAHLSPESLRGITKAFGSPQNVRGLEKQLLTEKAELQVIDI